MGKEQELRIGCKMHDPSRYASDLDCSICERGEGDVCPEYRAMADASIAAKRAAHAQRSVEIPDIKFVIADYLELRDEAMGFVSTDEERSKSAIELHDAIQTIHTKLAPAARRSSSDEQAEVVDDECPKCQGRGYQAGDPEAAPIEGCDWCAGTGRRASPSGVKAGVTEAQVEAAAQAIAKWQFPENGHMMRIQMAICVQMARAALTAALAVHDEGMGEGWQPIDTAPKDRSHFLAAYSDGKVVEAYYLDNSKSRMPWAGYRPASSLETVKPGVRFVLWCPLPTPPIQGDAK